MKKILSAVLGVILALILSGCSLPQVKGIRDEPQEAATTPSVIETTQVKIQSNGFEPESIMVLSGQTVTFINLDRDPVSIASDPYPENSDLPDLYSKPIYKNETYQYTFSRPGKFGYHLQENPSVRGKVVVK